MMSCAAAPEREEVPELSTEILELGKSILYILNNQIHITYL